MKRLISVVILLAIITTVYFTGDIYIKKIINESYTLVENCTKNYNNNKNATKSAEKLKKFWSENEGILSMFAHHDSIDVLEKAIDSLVIYSKTKNSEIFYEYSATIKTLLHQLYEDNSFSMHSIL